MPALFVSISKENSDYELFSRFNPYLNLLKKLRYVDAFWHKFMLLPGENETVTLSEKITQSGIFLSVISVDYLNDCEQEMELIGAHPEKEHNFIIPFVLKPCPWEEFDVFKGLYPIPERKKSFIEVSNQETILNDLYNAIVSAAQKRNNHKMEVSGSSSKITSPDNIKYEARLSMAFVDFVAHIKNNVSVSDAFLKSLEQISEEQKNIEGLISTTQMYVQLNNLLSHELLRLSAELERNEAYFEENIHEKISTSRQANFEKRDTINSVNAFQDFYDNSIDNLLKTTKKELEIIVNTHLSFVMSFSDKRRLEDKCSEVIQKRLHAFVELIFDFITRQQIISELDKNIHYQQITLPAFEIPLIGITKTTYNNVYIINPFQLSSLKSSTIKFLTNELEFVTNQISENIYNSYYKITKNYIVNLDFKIHDLEQNIDVLKREYKQFTDSCRQSIAKIKSIQVEIDILVDNNKSILNDSAS